MPRYQLIVVGDARISGTGAGRIVSGETRKVELKVQSMKYYPEPSEVRAMERGVVFTAVTVGIVAFLLIRVIMV